MLWRYLDVLTAGLPSVSLCMREPGLWYFFSGAVLISFFEPSLLESMADAFKRRRSRKHQANQLVVRPQHLVINATRGEELTDSVRALEVEVASGMVMNGALNDPLTGGLQKQLWDVQQSDMSTKKTWPPP